MDRFTLDRVRLARFLFWSIFWAVIVSAAPSVWAATLYEGTIRYFSTQATGDAWINSQIATGSIQTTTCEPAAGGTASSAFVDSTWNAGGAQPNNSGFWSGTVPSYSCRYKFNSQVAGADTIYRGYFALRPTPAGVGTCPAGLELQADGSCEEPSGPPTDAECQSIYGASPASPVEISWNETGFATVELAAAYSASCGDQNIEPFGADLGCTTRVVDDRCACGISAGAGASGYTVSCVGYASSYSAGDPPVEEEVTADEEYAPAEIPLETTVTEDEISLCLKTATSEIEVAADGGVVSLCTVTTTTDTGASCTTAGDTQTVRRCEALYADGSTATTVTRTGTVDGVTTTNTGSTTTTGPGTGLYPGVEEGEDGSAYGFRSCQQPPICDGDTLQCGEIELAWLQACQGYLVAEAYDGELVGMNADVLAEIEAGGSSIDLETAGFLDEVGSLEGSRSCPAPLTFTALGQTFSFPLDTLCDYASYLALLILGFASFRAVKIALGGVQAAVT